MNLNKPKIFEHYNKSLNYTCYDVKRIPKSSRVVSLGSFARGTGNLSIWNLQKNKNKSIGTELNLLLESEQKNPLKCCTFDCAPNEKRLLATGDLKGNVNVWDLEKISANECNFLYRVEKAHAGMIHSIDGAGSSFGCPEIVTGGVDGAIKIWDIRQKEKPVVFLQPTENEKKIFDCRSVAFGNSFNDDERIVVGGYENGDLKLFDLKMNKLRRETNLQNGICCLEFDRKDTKMNKLLATTLEGKFKIFDLCTFNKKEGFACLTSKIEEDSSATVWSGRHLPQNRDVFLVSGGSGYLYLYKYSYPSQKTIGEGEDKKGVAGTVELLSKEMISTQPVYAVDWNKNKEGLAITASYDQSIKIVLVTKLKTI